VIATLAKTIKRLTRCITVSAALGFAGTASFAQADIYSNDTLITEFEYGLACNVDAVGSKPAPGTELGLINLITPTAFSTHSTIVPAQLGWSFGVKSRALGGVPFNDVLFFVTHPPYKDSGTTDESWVGTISADETSAQMFSFDIPAELATGKWTLSAKTDGQLLYRVTFDVVSPANAPAYLLSLCKGDALTS
jgi:hypothetical protein